MFDPRDPYERLWWHYDSRRPLSVAQIVALGSVDVYTASLAWLLLENGSSLTVGWPDRSAARDWQDHNPECSSTISPGRHGPGVYVRDVRGFCFYTIVRY